MQLEGPQQKQLQAALISAFPTRLSLEQMVFHGLGVHLAAITAEGSLEQVVFELLRWAQVRGTLEELIISAISQNSGNQELQRVAVLVGVSSGLSSSDVPPAVTLPSIWNIPYPRNPFFTGQEAVLTQLTNALKAGQAAALSQPQAISGLGGIGKTQMALEFAYRHRQEYEAVLWVLADTRESLVSGYIAIAQLLGLAQKDEQDQQVIVLAVKFWLQTHGSWLLILDNADELTVVREFVPPSFGSHILLTTRAQSMGRFAKGVEVGTMSQDVGALFLLRRAGIVAEDTQLDVASSSDVGTAREISEELGGLPLALDQAGAYIEEVRCDLASYLASYRKRRAVLLARRGGVVDDHPDSVAATWSLSFEKVEQQSRVSADLLRVCAFLAPDAIPEEIIVEGASHLGQSLALVTGDEVALDEAIVPLLAYSLIHRDRGTKTLSIHRLVQAVLKDGMDEQTRRQWAQRVVLAVNAAFPAVECETWPQCERSLPHALVCAHRLEQEKLVLLEAASLLHRLGRYLDDRGQYHEAERWYTRVLAIVEEQLGAAHPRTALSLNDLARQYYKQGRYLQAEPLLVRALAIHEEQLGESHPGTANTLTYLANLYEYQGKYEQAEALVRRTLAIREEQLGSTHLDTAWSLFHLGYLSQVQGRYAEAESVYDRALKIREEQLGESHPETANSLVYLGDLYRVQGRYAEAEPRLERALKIYEEQSGESHPDTAMSLNNLALLYKNQGKDEEAESICLRALKIREERLGPRHPDTAGSLYNLATLYEQQKKYYQAECLFRLAFVICEQTLGQDHSNTQRVQQRYIKLQRALGRDQEAAEISNALHFAIGENERAMTVLNDVIGQYPQWMPAYVARGHTSSRLKEHKRATFRGRLFCASPSGREGRSGDIPETPPEAALLDPAAKKPTPDSISGLGWAGVGDGSGGGGCPPPAFDP